MGGPERLTSASTVAGLFSGRAQAAEPAMVDGQPGLVWRVGDRPRVLWPARVYAHGTSEPAFGRWLQSRGCRDQLVVIGKGAHHDSLTFERRVNRAAIHEDVLASLEAMQLDRMDIYFLHKDDPDAAVGPIVEALNKESEAGRIGVFGESSWSHQRIAEANAYAQAHGLQPFTVSSPNLALAVPNEPMWVGCISLSGDAEALDWYGRSQMPVFAWSAQARGFFSGRLAQPGARPTATPGTSNRSGVPDHRQHKRDRQLESDPPVAEQTPSAQSREHHSTCQ